MNSVFRALRHLTSGQSNYFSGQQECPPDSGLDLTILLYSLSRWLGLRSLNSISKRFGIPLKYYPLEIARLQLTI